MTKAYWIAHVTIDDPDAYDAYRRANAAPFAEYGARFLVRGGAQQVVEGHARPRSVVIEFPRWRRRRPVTTVPAIRRPRRCASRSLPQM